MKCQTCGKENYEGARFCEECGTKLAAENGFNPNEPPPNMPPDEFQYTETPVFSNLSNLSSGSVTSVGIPPVVEEPKNDSPIVTASSIRGENGVHAGLTIERGNNVGKEFPLSADESYLGRWDADNGIFPDVDLDAHDPEAKVSRRHARIIRRGGAYQLEDLGSTNGTYINRGRRLIPGTPQVLSDGDEIIIGKTFLRFRIDG